MSSSTPEKIIQGILQGEIRAAARAMRWVDDRDDRAEEVLRELYKNTGEGLIIGVTGNPGSGKSTLVDTLVKHYRSQDKSVGVVAVDPSSPFSGGAILGDRIRMQRHYLDSGVFIRSLATRGYLGGLSASTLDTLAIMDAMGRDVIIVETVGVGQDEVDIVRAAHVTVVVVVPGLGDEIQALKAGVLEIADVYCINKADRDGVHALERELQTMQEFDHQSGREFRPMIRTVAVREEGIAELADAIDGHVEKTRAQGGNASKQERERMDLGLRKRLERKVIDIFLENPAARKDFSEALEKVLAKESDPYTETDSLIKACIDRTLDPGTSGQ